MGRSISTSGSAATARLRAGVGAADPVRYTAVDGVRLAHEERGAGAALVCLHAIGHGAGDFARLLERFGDRYRVLALDWPGQGSSAMDQRPASAERYAHLLGGFLDAVEVESAVLIGNSIGGAAALRFAAAHPRRVRGLVLENPGGLAPTGDRAARLVLRAMAGFFAAGRRRARWFPAAFALYYRTVLQRRRARRHRDRITASAYEIAPVLEEAWRSFVDPDADIRSLAPAIECPVLFAWATRDQVVSLSRSRPAIERFPRARLERFPAGHAPHLETPQAFEAALERFLDEIEGCA